MHSESISQELVSIAFVIHFYIWFLLKLEANRNAPTFLLGKRAAFRRRGRLRGWRRGWKRRKTTTIPEGILLYLM